MKLIKRIRRALSRPETGVLRPETLAGTGRLYPSRSLTPEALSAIFAEADEGRTERQMELYEEMEEKDAHLRSVIETRKLAVAGLSWDLLPASGSPEDMRAADIVRDALKGIENLDEGLLALMDAVAKGFSIVELVWQISKETALIREMRPLRQRIFTFSGRGGRIHETPRLISPEEPVYGEELMPGKFAVHYASGRSGAPVRAGVMRPCAWMYLFKNYTLKDWVVFSERFAQPMRVGKFGPAATEAERKVLRQAVFNLGADAAAVISDSTVIELLESEGKRGSAEVYERLASYCDRAMSKAVLGQTLTTEQAGGTYATARVHDAVRHDILEADAAALARTVRSSIVRPLMEYNFGPGAALPVFRFSPEPGGDLKELAETYSILKGMGVEVEERHIRERFGLPGGRPASRPGSREKEALDG